MREHMEKNAAKFKDKLKLIKVALFDVDGILTDGRVYYQGEEMGFNRFFHIHDGYGLKLLQKAGIKVGVITGGNSLGVMKRFENLQLDHIYLGNEDKRSAYLDILQKENVQDENILYMGDEFFDIPLLQRAGFSATNKQAHFEVQECVDYITLRDAGMGCVREVIDLVCLAQNIRPEIPDFFK